MKSVKIIIIKQKKRTSQTNFQLLKVTGKFSLDETKVTYKRRNKTKVKITKDDDINNKKEIRIKSKLKEKDR